MSEYRPIKTKIWHDNWFLTLNQEEKLFWIFLLTNEYVHISGLYELPEPLISPLTGIKDYDKLLNKFVKSNKILYQDGWIYIINYYKNQSKQINKKDNTYKARENYFKENKPILDKLGISNEAPYKPLKAPYHTLPKEFKEFKEFKELQATPADNINPLLKEFEVINPTINYGNTTQRKALQDMVKQFGYEKLLNTIRFAVSIQGKPYSPVITTPCQLKDNMGKLLVYFKKEENNKTIII